MGLLELPPGEKWRQFELRALALRDFARVRPDVALDPFALARFANLVVVDFDRVKELSAQSRERLLGPASDEWSGGACSLPLPDGKRIVILNPSHGPQRSRSTLMEEICHVFLGHQPNRLSVIARDNRGRTVARDYRKTDEEEAYAIGAAALVPFSSLRHLLLRGKTMFEIAKHFQISRDLVEYRLKVTRLWSCYKAAHDKKG